VIEAYYGGKGLGHFVANIKNKCCVLACMILVIGVFAGCGANKENDTVPEQPKIPELGIRYIDVTTAEQNDDRVFSVRWPQVVRTGSLAHSGNKLENAINVLTKEEAEYFINYVENIEVPDFANKHIKYVSQEDYKGHQYLGSVTIMYDDGNGNCKTTTRFIFDKYPAGYSEFIKEFGRICGEDHIPMDYNLQDVTVEYFRRMARIDLTVPDEIVEEFLDITECDMFLLLEDYNIYEAKHGIEWIETYRHMPRKIVSEASTENELKEYVLEIANKFGVQESKVYEDKVGGYYFMTQYGSVDVYPSNGYPYPEYISELECECSKVKFYNIQDNGGPEGMVYANTFVYSDDGKFMVILPDCVGKDINEMIKTIFDE